MPPKPGSKVEPSPDITLHDNLTVQTFQNVFTLYIVGSSYSKQVYLALTTVCTEVNINHFITASFHTFLFRKKTLKNLFSNLLFLSSTLKRQIHKFTISQSVAPILSTLLSSTKDQYQRVRFNSFGQINHVKVDSHQSMLPIVSCQWPSLIPWEACSTNNISNQEKSIEKIFYLIKIKSKKKLIILIIIN